MLLAHETDSVWRIKRLKYYILENVNASIIFRKYLIQECINIKIQIIYFILFILQDCKNVGQYKTS